MTLRSRLVLALVGLSTVGLALFGTATYTLYERSQRQQLDDQLLANAQELGTRLGRVGTQVTGGDECGAAETDEAGVGNDDGSGGGGPSRGGAGFGPGQGLDAYVELIDADGTTIACSEPLSTDARPALPDDLGADRSDLPGARRLVTTGSVSGDQEWRVLVATARFAGPGSGPGTGTVVIAVSTSGIDESMRRLVGIELTAAVALLTALGLGAWFILRRGLRPLEQMASSASTITAGDLSERVEPADDHTEVGQLGLALNTMLDGIEHSFREREATEARLRQFLADASHELRTPLTSIQGFAELFRLGGSDDRVDLPVILRRIEQESGRMKNLVEDLLLLARLDETRPAGVEPVDLTVLAADACSDAVAIAPERRVTLDAPVPVVVQGDADLLRQAIANLVTNAVRHTPEGTPIQVATRRQGDRALVTVRDHGPGLDAEAMAHVFDRFWQADRARVGAGSGLGLAIVAGIAEEHGGSATVANLVDGGAAFTLDIAGA